MNLRKSVGPAKRGPQPSSSFGVSQIEKKSGTFTLRIFMRRLAFLQKPVIEVTLVSQQKNFKFIFGGPLTCKPKLRTLVSKVSLQKPKT